MTPVDVSAKEDGMATAGLTSRPRAIIAAMYGSYAAGAALHLGQDALGPGTPGGAVAAIAGLLLMVVAGGCLLLLYRSDFWRRGHAPDSQLDERELSLRNRAYLSAYQGVATLFLLAVIYLAFAVDFGLWLPTTYEQASTLVWGVLLFTLSLPSAVLAWTERPVIV